MPYSRLAYSRPYSQVRITFDQLYIPLSLAMINCLYHLSPVPITDQLFLALITCPKHRSIVPNTDQLSPDMIYCPNYNQLSLSMIMSP